jgi:hypothetical protein
VSYYCEVNCVGPEASRQGHAHGMVADTLVEVAALDFVSDGNTLAGE